MRFIYSVFLLVVSISLSMAQDSRSLLDSARSNIRKDSKAAFRLADSALDNASENSFKAEANLLLGDICYYIWDSLNMAMNFYNAALEFYDTDEKERHKIISNKTYIFNEKKEPYQTLAVIDEVIDFYQSVDNLQELYKLYARKGHAFILSGQNDSAVFYLKKAASGYESIGDITQSDNAINGIALALADMDDREGAARYLSEIYFRSLSSGDSARTRGLANNLSIQYSHLDQLDSAKKYAEISFNISQKLGVEEWIVRGHSRLAHIALLEKNYQGVFAHCREVFSSREVIGNLDSRRACYKYSAEAHLGAGNLVEAEKWGKKLLAATEEFNRPTAIYSAHEILYLIYKEKKEFSKALMHLERFEEIMSAHKNEENLASLNELNVRFDLERKNNVIAKLEQKARIQELALTQSRIILGATVGAGILLLVIGYLLFRQKVLRKEQEKVDSQQKLLRSQLNPHFLFNALNAIQYTIINDSDRIKTSDYVAKFSSLTRQILDNSREDFITLKQETVFLEHYLELQQLRFKKPFGYKIDLNLEEDLEDVLIPPMFTQPFIENSIEHGVISKENSGEIRISFETSDEKLKIVIADNGVGREYAAFQKRNQAHRSVATSITRERLKYFQKRWKKKISFKIDDIRSEENKALGTRVEFELPLMIAV